MFAIDISPKVNLIVRFLFKIAYYDVTARHICHDAVGLNTRGQLGNEHKKCEKLALTRINF